MIASPSLRVQVVDNNFVPYTASVKVGDVIEWYHTGFNTHTISAANKLVWDSGAFIGGELFQMSFKEPGTFIYRCFFHTGMQGVIIVN